MWPSAMSMQEMQPVCPLSTARGKDWMRSHTMHCVSQEPVTKQSSLHRKHLTPPCTGTREQCSHQHSQHSPHCCVLQPLTAAAAADLVPQQHTHLPATPHVMDPAAVEAAASVPHTRNVPMHTHTREAGYLAVMSAEPEITFRTSNVAQVMPASCPWKEKHNDCLKNITYMYT